MTKPSQPQKVCFTCLVLLAICALAAIVVADKPSSITNPKIVSMLRRYKRQTSTTSAGDVAGDHVKPQYQFAYHAVAGKEDGENVDFSRVGSGFGQPAFSKIAEFGHAEVRDGDRTTGKYFVQLPDGRLQTVNYFVLGESGYVANVAYE